MNNIWKLCNNASANKNYKKSSILLRLCSDKSKIAFSRNKFIMKLDSTLPFSLTNISSEKNYCYFCPDHNKQFLQCLIKYHIRSDFFVKKSMMQCRNYRK